MTFELKKDKKNNISFTLFNVNRVSFQTKQI